MRRLVALFIPALCVFSTLTIGCTKKEAGPQTISIADMVRAAEADEDKFKTDFVGKQFRVDNLTTYAVRKFEGGEQYVDAFSYDPASDTIYTSGESKLAGRPIKSTDSDFFIKLVFANPADLDSLTDCKEETVNETVVRDYPAPYSVVAVVEAIEGNSITLGNAALVKK